MTSDFELNLTANPFILVSRYISHLESNDQAKNEAGEIEDVVQVLVIDSSDSVGGGIRPNYRPGLATYTIFFCFLLWLIGVPPGRALVSSVQSS